MTHRAHGDPVERRGSKVTLLTQLHDAVAADRHGLAGETIRKEAQERVRAVVADKRHRRGDRARVAALGEKRRAAVTLHADRHLEATRGEPVRDTLKAHGSGRHEPIGTSDRDGEHRPQAPAVQISHHALAHIVALVATHPFHHEPVHVDTILLHVRLDLLLKEEAHMQLRSQDEGHLPTNRRVVASDRVVHRVRLPSSQKHLANPHALQLFLQSSVRPGKLRNFRRGGALGREMEARSRSLLARFVQVRIDRARSARAVIDVAHRSRGHKVQGRSVDENMVALEFTLFVHLKQAVRQ
mmetsp:Transcript_18058/g.42541  ORF Transcript_18058/g.42541 Transcript_18058/m.42541 type:complete len:298 (-) Transcript_18058:878-1771(-)